MQRALDSLAAQQAARREEEEKKRKLMQTREREARELAPAPAQAPAQALP